MHTACEKPEIEERRWMEIRKNDAAHVDRWLALEGCFSLSALAAVKPQGLPSRLRVPDSEQLARCTAAPRTRARLSSFEYSPLYITAVELVGIMRSAIGSQQLTSCCESAGWRFRERIHPARSLSQTRMKRRERHSLNQNHVVAMDDGGAVLVAQSGRDLVRSKAFDGEQGCRVVMRDAASDLFPVRVQ